MSLNQATLVPLHESRLDRFAENSFGFGFLQTFLIENIDFASNHSKDLVMVV